VHWFNKHRLVAMLIDFPVYTPLDAETKLQNDTLAKHYDVAGYPTVHAIKASDKSSLGKIVGYDGSDVATWITKFSAIAKLSS